jgi:hypothetical protein
MAEAKNVVAYESKASRMIIPVYVKGVMRPHLEFVSPTKFVHGTLTLDAATLNRSGLTLDEAVKIVEDLPEYKGGVPGQRGIWRKEKRIEAKVNNALSTIRKALNEYDETRLRAELSRFKVEIPVGATQEQLANLLYEQMTGTSEAPAVIDQDAPRTGAKAGSVQRGVQTK